MKFKPGQRVKLLETSDFNKVERGDEGKVVAVNKHEVDLLLDKRPNEILTVGESCYNKLEVIKDPDNEYETEEEYDPCKEIKKLKKIIKLLLEK